MSYDGKFSWSTSNFICGSDVSGLNIMLWLLFLSPQNSQLFGVYCDVLFVYHVVVFGPYAAFCNMLILHAVG